ncbi:MAG: AMP-dependent synthetase and ligase, partial [Acidobacteria bacterium]|nr:AMP-dependent synthetase and ligase [Acidobacteriota bacterium]
MKVSDSDIAPVATLAELPAYLAGRFDRPILLRRCVAEGFHEFSTREFVDEIRALSLGLRQFGVEPGDRVGLVCESRPEWSIADLAILTAGAVNVPVYPTLSAAQTQFILHEAGVKVVVVSDGVQLAKIAGLAPELPALTDVIVVAPAAGRAGQPAVGPAVHTLRDVVAEHRARIAADASLARQYEEQVRRVGAGDVATIIYTSGTTGHPKGVVLTHRNLLSNMVAVNAVVGIRGDDAPLSFLPLSHVFERVSLYLFLLLGCHVSFAESLQTVSRDLMRVRPTVMTGVPRVFEKFHHAVLDALASAPAARKALFHWALRVGSAISGARLAGKRPPLWAVLQRPLADALVLRKIRARVGGRLRLMVSGSAPLAHTTGEFLFAVGLPISEAYGLTESS